MPPSRLAERGNDDQIYLVLLRNSNNFTRGIAKTYKRSANYALLLEVTDDLIQTLLCILVKQKSVVCSYGEHFIARAEVCGNGPAPTKPT